jgi:hypothetical protein
MSEEILTEELIIEKSDLELIYEQNDCTETIVYEEGIFSNIIYTVISSPTLGIKVLTVPKYIEEFENNFLVGRRVVDYNRTTLNLNDEITIIALNIL